MDLIQVLVSVVTSFLAFTASVASPATDSIAPEQNTVIVQNTTVQQTTTSAKPSLSKEAGFYVSIYNPEGECKKWGGVWFNKDDVVGCALPSTSNVQVNSCGNFLLEKAKEKCISMNAQWTCDNTGIYCKY